MRYWSTAPHTELARTLAWLDEMITDAPAERDDFVIELDGEAVGKAGCWRLPEIGFILHPECWGRGLAREALAAVIAHLFHRHDFDAITADVDPRNERSLKLLRGLGFHETGRASRTWHIGEEWCDSIYLALAREDWNSGERRPDPGSR
jgi:RimJ/RimL family protein N-acetyltransferase